ncbi:MAG: hypothetical protein KDJ38_06465 [Gammaproteobacteria bacterium]|nr:hypothetical protein [Gammaproteobacteria bacterium]
MRKSVLSLFIASAMTFSVADAKQQAILLGGGYLLEGSQGQIELNLKWVQEILQARGIEPRVFYTDGDDQNPDIFIQQPVAESLQNLQPLARVFGQQVLNGVSYRNHEVAGVESSTDRETLLPVLNKTLQNVKPDDELLFVYNGHGSPSEGAADEVALKLWNDTRLSAGEFQETLAGLDPAVAFRYVFTQCYSGGFHRLIYQDSKAGHQLAEPLRCGFTAESAWRQSEGCSASIDMGDYRDYTTFFFAALNGKDRLERPLLADPDQNADGRTTLREAHLYTLEYAHSTDLSRSSSEDYLEQWRPWYLKWLPLSGDMPDNEYASLAKSVATHNDINETGLLEAVRSRLATLRAEFETLQAQQYQARDEAEQVREALQGRLIARWPQLGTPYTLAYKTLLLDGSDEVQNWIVSQQDYPQLRDLQDSDAEYDQQILETERNLAQLEKILRLRKLAFLQAWLYDYGSSEDIAGYEKLVGCESSAM